MSKETILIVEDEEDIQKLIQYNLEKEGYSTFCVSTGEAALSEAKRIHPSLILLDIMLPGTDGLEVCRQLSRDQKTQDIPVLMVTAKSEDSDIVIGLEMGADDYITKPFSPKVLIARVRAILRRQIKTVPEEPKGTVSIHGILIDSVRHEISSDNQNLDLSLTEFSILEYLARNPGWVFSRSQIIGAVKGDDYPVTERAVDVQILGLRKKLGEKGSLIETVRGIGYRMKEEE